MYKLLRYAAFSPMAMASSFARAESCSTPQLVSLGALMGNLKSIEIECGKYPSNFFEIYGRSPTKYSECAKKYLPSPPVDPFGNLYHYHLDTSHWYPVFLYSPGKDGIWGTKDDVSNRMPNGEPLDSFSTSCSPSLLEIFAVLMAPVLTFVFVYAYRKRRKST